MMRHAPVCTLMISAGCYRLPNAVRWGILAAPVRDTMKRAEPGIQAIAHTVDRQDLWHALTPQLFPLELLKLCLSRALREGWR